MRGVLGAPVLRHFQGWRRPAKKHERNKRSGSQGFNLGRFRRIRITLFFRFQRKFP
jgi:hypothetical protein